MTGTGSKPVPCLSGALDEANFGARAWAPIEGSAIVLVEPWRIVYCHDADLKQVYPVAVMGMGDEGSRSRRRLQPVLKEVTAFFEDRAARREAKLFRIGDLATNDQVAEMMRVQAATVAKWRERERDFPAPVFGHKAGQLYLWDRREVYDWARRDGRLIYWKDRREDIRRIK
jgi:hypothetical protein